MALRPKSQILMEEWGTTDPMRVFKLARASINAPNPPLETWTTMKLPYLAPSFTPDMHLPSLKELREATEKHSLHFVKTGLHPVCKIGNTIVKYGGAANVVEEAENILFLAEKRPELRLPTVLAVWIVLSELGTPVYCMMQNFIEGIQVRPENFKDLPIKAQDRICSKISSQIAYLQALPSEEYYGRVHGQGWVKAPLGINHATSTDVKTVSGPYYTYEEFTSALFRARDSQQAFGLMTEEWPPEYEERRAKFRSVFPDWEPNEPRFTWIDPKPANVIARPIKGDDGNEDWDVFLIDWEQCGWYPAWVQSFQVTHRWVFMYVDKNQAKDKSGIHPVVWYREDELLEGVRQHFDPNPDLDRVKKLQEADWGFF
ncbi:hypothetical protein K491DRAFT_608607 [Lophiostoma macrostomum CBS 122681]|uniref:Aminoglycoside phosphotransferase domain-containing protein n=1 Tax=Lophiostoma macrostomum CBS 122681 TaxID=1314788 RepID=A0A6A6SRW6_9PLEO|nr:hypothetical protein K491DRAFT_608607 [Lophiostoma macrostomum CBS 122681]